MDKAIVLFSGGQDSTTCLFWAKQSFDSVLALSFDYNQRHRMELESAQRIANLAGVDHEIVEMGSIFAGLSPLTASSERLNTFASAADLPTGVQSTFVPGRNILFLCVAANRAWVNGCTNLVIGVSQEDFGGYPDCRQDFIEKMQSAVSSGLDKRMTIHAPLMHLTKAKTVEMARTLPGCWDALAHSMTCYDGQRPPCGACHSCLLRAKGFAEAGFPDPLIDRSAHTMKESNEKGKEKGKDTDSAYHSTASGGAANDAR